MDVGTGGADIISALRSFAEQYPKGILSGLPILGVAAAAYLFVALIFWLKARAPRKDRVLHGVLQPTMPGEMYRNPSARIDLWHSLLSITIFLPLIGLVFAIVGGIPVDALLRRELGPSPFVIRDTWTAAWLQFAVLVIAQDFGFWLAHLLSHKVPLLWRLHRAHHSADVLTFFTAFRVYPLDVVWSHSFEATFGAVALGAALYVSGTKIGGETVILLTVFAFFLTAKTVLDHSHFWISLGPLNRVFCAPIMHQIHHSAEERHWDRNMGRSLTVWDWMFGTIYVPKGEETFEVGLHDERGERNPHNRLRNYYIEPIATFWEHLKSLLPKRSKTHSHVQQTATQGDPERKLSRDGDYQNDGLRGAPFWTEKRERQQAS